MNPSKLIDEEIASLPDWRGKTLAAIRRIIRAAEPGVIEEWKWMGTPVWSHHGLVCAADAHTNVVKMIFFKGASLADPAQLFNAELSGTTRRAIKFFEGDAIDERALETLVRAGVELNGAKAQAGTPPRSPGARHKSSAKAKAASRSKAKPAPRSKAKPAIRSKAKPAIRSKAKPAIRSKAKPALRSK